MEPTNNKLAGISQTSVGLRGSEEGRRTVHRRLVGLTITVGKIDRVLADVQTQIKTLRQNRINLRLVRGNWPAWKQSGEVNERRHCICIMDVGACLLGSGLGRVGRRKTSIQAHCERTA
jgi:hypothetical protein